MTESKILNSLCCGGAASSGLGLTQVRPADPRPASSYYSRAE